MTVTLVYSHTRSVLVAFLRYWKCIVRSAFTNVRRSCFTLRRAKICLSIYFTQEAGNTGDCTRDMTRAAVLSYVFAGLNFERKLAHFSTIEGIRPYSLLCSFFSSDNYSPS